MSPPDDEDEAKFAAVLATLFKHIRDIVAAKIGAAEPNFSDVVDELTAAEASGAFDMDRLLSSRSPALRP